MIAGYRLLPWLFDAMVGPLMRLGSFSRQEQPPTTGNVLHPDRGADEVLVPPEGSAR